MRPGSERNVFDVVNVFGKAKLNLNNLICRYCGSGLSQLGEVCGDNPGLKVLRCEVCALTQLSDFSHIDEAYYSSDQYIDDVLRINSLGSISAASERECEWNKKRVNMIREYIPQAGEYTVLDYGAGHGGFVKEAKGLFKEVIPLDVSKTYHRYYDLNGWKSVTSLGDLDLKIDMVVLFHVLEHLREPWSVLSEILTLLGTVKFVVLEVPNTEEALNAVLNSSDYKKVHYSSDHLYYFTFSSLRRIVEHVGLRIVKETGYQRYGLANNISWLIKGRGVEDPSLTLFDDFSLNDQYEKVLVQRQLCDSIFFICANLANLTSRETDTSYG